MNQQKVKSLSNLKNTLGKKESPGLLKIFLRLISFIIILAAILFLSAGRLNWEEGWAFMAMYAFVTVIALFVVPLDPELIEERTHLKKDVKKWDKILTATGSFLYPLAILIVAGLDFRKHWSLDIPLVLELGALAIAFAGNLISVWATRVNKFYSRFVRIQKERGHFVVTEGPYKIIRHPGYLGQIIFSLTSAIALGSFWAIVPGGLFATLLVIRTVLEDKTLQNELVGYKEYALKVRYRLIPRIW